jgi:hypothetical protein
MMTEPAAIEAIDQAGTPRQELITPPVYEVMSLADGGLWAPGYYFVSEQWLLRRAPGKLEQFEQAQRAHRERAEARRANDALIKNLTQIWRGFLVQRSTLGGLQILSDHLVGIDDHRDVLVFGPVAVSGRFKHEEVRAQRRVMLAVAKTNPLFVGFEVIAISTKDSERWRDGHVLDRMGFSSEAEFTQQGNSWLTKITGGADVSSLVQPEDRMIALTSTSSPGLRSIEFDAEVEASADAKAKAKVHFKLLR